MPYVDDFLVLSSNQVPTVTAVSTKSFDSATATRNIGAGEEIDIVVDVTVSFAGGTSLAVSLQDSADNTTFADVMIGPAIVTASLTAGTEIFRFLLPRTLRRYFALNYTIVGTMSGGGAIMAYLEPADRQDNVARASGYTVF